MNKNKSIYKLTKCILALASINIIAFSFALLLNSCKSENDTSLKSQKARTAFINALNSSKSSLSAIQATKPTATIENQSKSKDVTGLQDVYIEFNGNNPDNFDLSIQSIKDVSDVLYKYDAILQYAPTKSNVDYQIQIPIIDIVNSLRPLIVEAKRYLYSKGFTETDIEDMIMENQGEEHDLIPFVITLINLEKKEQLASISHFSFIQKAQALDANDYYHCALTALGFDAGFTISGLTSSKWTVAVMKRAFRVVATRALGPIGVAVAVISFGVCLTMV